MSKLVSGGCGLWSGAALLAAAILSGCGSSRGEPLLGAAGGFTASAGTGTGGNGGLPAGGTGGGLFTGPQADAGAGAECERSVSLTAVTLSEPQPFDLIIVADNSDSLAWSRSELSSGLHDLLTRVQGRSVRVFLLTPTQYGATSANAKMPLSGDSVVAWQDPETGSAYQNAVTQFEQVCTDPAGATITCPSALGPTPYSVQGTWRFVMPPPIATIRPDMTDAEFGMQRDAVASAILALEGHGSPHEQPLCTLSRYISQDPSVLPTNAVFLLIEDEDDISVPRECLSGFSAQLSTVKAEAGSTPCTSNCDAYRYSAIGSSRTKGFNFACAAFDDLGKAIPGTDQSGYASQGNQPTCDGIVAGACTAEESQTVGTFCEPGRTLLSCERECGAFDALSCSVELHDGAIDPCTQAFTLGGKNYANLADYCAGRGSGWHACTGGGLNIQYTSSLGGGYSPTYLMYGQTTADIGAYFKTKANAVFKPGGYQLEGIVLEPEFSCTLGQGQSYAKNLAEFIADKSHLFPICQTYAPALDGVLSFAQGLIQTDFQVHLAADEAITQVRIIAKDGTSRVLTAAAYQYARATETLSLSRSALTSQDARLSVEVTSDCRPVVR